MSALDESNFADMNTYHFLVVWNLTAQPVQKAGDQKVQGLGYWNDADPENSKKSAGSQTNNLLLYCLTYAKPLGTQWVSDDESTRLSDTNKLASTMATATSLVSEIAAQLAKIFTFTSSAIPSPYATKFASTVATSNVAPFKPAA